MRLLQLVWANCRRLLSQVSTIVFIIGLPVGILIFQNMLMSGAGPGSTGIYVQNLDQGVYAEKVLEQTGLRYESVEDATDPFALLENYSAEILYVFPSDFSEQMERGELPPVERFARDPSPLFDHYDQAIEQQIRQFFLAGTFARSGLLTEEEYFQEPSITAQLRIEEYDLSFNYVFSMLMIVYFIMLFSSATGTDLLELREQKVTSRMFVSPNHSIEIMAALAISYFLLIFVSYGIVITIARYVFEVKDFPLGLTLLIISLMSLFSLSLSLFLGKITRNKSVLQMVPTFYGMLGYLATLYGLIERTDSGFIVKAAYATPIYWVKEILLRGDVVKNASIILLMCLVLLTAGSYNLRSFAGE